MALRAQVGESNMGGTPEHTISQSSEMTSVADPFFGQTHTSDHHSRQESGDSGLGESSEQTFLWFLYRKFFSYLTGNFTL